MKLNKKTISRILLITVFMMVLVALTGCEMTGNEGVDTGLQFMSGGFLGGLFLLMYSILCAIASIFIMIFSFISGLFQLIGELIAFIF